MTVDLRLRSLRAPPSNIPPSTSRKRPMFVYFLLAAAAAIVVVMLLFLGWRQLDRRVQMAYSEESAEDLKAMLEQALEEQKHLTSRIEHLEAIIASEPWETLSSGSTSSSLSLPDEHEKPSSEDQVERRRQRNR